MVPTLTCGLVRENTSLAIVPPQVQLLYTPNRNSGRRVVTRPQELLLGVEPRTSSLPMKCSTTELKQRLSCLFGLCPLLPPVSPFSIAVGAHDITLGDLVQDDLLRCSSLRQSAQTQSLRRALPMVEIHDIIRILHSTI